MTGGDPPPGGDEPERFEPDELVDLPAELALAQLPGGRHGLPRAFVVRNQRLRIVAAMLRLLPRHGFTGITIGHLTHEAGVSRATFYAQFANKGQCFLATYDLAGQWLCERVERAIASGEEWPSRVRSGVSEALGLLAANPPLAHLIAVEPARAGAPARERQRACIGRFAAVLRAGRPDDDKLPADLEELLLGGLFSLIGRYVEAGRTERLVDASAELIQCMLIPYLEPDETRRIVDRAA